MADDKERRAKFYAIAVKLYDAFTDLSRIREVPYEDDAEQLKEERRIKKAIANALSQAAEN